MARCNLICARFGVSSTVISTCRSSLRCSQFGLPRFASSYVTFTRIIKSKQALEMVCGLARIAAHAGDKCTRRRQSANQGDEVEKETKVEKVNKAK